MTRAPFLASALAACVLLVGCAEVEEDAFAPMDAPRWEVGDHWVHRGINLEDRLDDIVRTEVVSIDDVHGRQLYRVRVTGNFTDSPMEQYYDMDLDRAWLKWGSPCGALPGGEGRECTSGDHWYEWPLREGRTWDVHEGGDVREGGRATVTRATGAGAEQSYHIAFQDRESGGMYARLETFSPAHGWYTAIVQYNDVGTPVAFTTLVETSYRPGPRA